MDDPFCKPLGEPLGDGDKAGKRRGAPPPIQPIQPFPIPGGRSTQMTRPIACACLTSGVIIIFLVNGSMKKADHTVTICIVKYEAPQIDKDGPRVVQSISKLTHR